MSIGDTLAEARRGAGLTVTQVSQRTRIRETIIRGIEQNDFTVCGGDFYARGHLRSIAAVVGVDAAPLVDEYDRTRGASRPIRAAEVFAPVTPIRVRERRRSLPWSGVLILVLLAVIGYGAYRLVSATSRPGGRSHPSAAGHTHRPAPSPTGSSPTATPSATRTRKPTSRDTRIALAVTTESCWVDLTTSGGSTIYMGILSPGTTRTWQERHPVNLRLGNPGAVTLTVDGTRRSLATKNPVTLSVGPGNAVAVTSGSSSVGGGSPVPSVGGTTTSP